MSRAGADILSLPVGADRHAQANGRMMRCRWVGSVAVNSMEASMAGWERGGQTMKLVADPAGLTPAFARALGGQEEMNGESERA